MPVAQSSEVLAARLRADLIQSYQDRDGSVSLIVKDPQRGRFFRFGEVEAFLLGRLSGACGVEELQKAVEEQFGAALTEETLDQFVSKLGRLGLLEAGKQEPPKPVVSNGKRIRGNLLYLRFPGFDPDGVLTWLAGRLRFCFSRPFVIFSAAVIASGIAFTVMQWHEIARDIPRLYNVHSLAAMYMTMLVVIGTHEFAHGVACKHFGGKVHEMGFLLLYFQPAFYCNVSDAWLFPKKSHRMWVSFAGAYWELFLWAIATFVWWITDPETVINYLALVVMGTSAVKSLFNLNPLIKLDGYYLLSDLLDVPNLRHRAVGFLRNRVRWLLGMEAQPEDRISPRERRIFVWYGLLAWTYSTVLLWLIGSNFFRFLTARYQGWGFVAFTILLAQVFHAPLKRSFTRRRGETGS